MKKYMVFTQMVDKFDAVPRPPGDLMAIGKLNRKTSPLPEGYNEWLADNMGELKQLKVCMPSHLLPGTGLACRHRLLCVRCPVFRRLSQCLLRCACTG